MASQTERDAILDDIENTLKAIEQGETYNYTPVKVTREALPFEAINVYPTYMIIEGPENFEYFGKRVVNWFMVLIRCIHRDERGLTRTEKISKMVKDVRHALVQDVQRGGIAANTEVISVETDEGWLVPLVTVEISLRIQYLTIEMYR